MMKKKTIVDYHMTNKNLKNGYVVLHNGRFEHRVVYFTKFPAISRRYEIHHINHTRDDNRLCNLIALPKPLHEKVHEYSRLAKRPLTRKEIREMFNAYLKKVNEDRWKKLATKFKKRKHKKKKPSKKFKRKQKTHFSHVRTIRKSDTRL